MTIQDEPFWDSIDFIAALRKCSSSRLAINGGMDATAFNKSKRHSKHGQLRWLSFGSLLRALSGANMTLLEFAVVYHVLRVRPKFSHTDQMAHIIQEINSAMQRCLAEIAESSDIDSGTSIAKG